MGKHGIMEAMGQPIRKTITTDSDLWLWIRHQALDKGIGVSAYIEQTMKYIEQVLKEASERCDSNMADTVRVPGSGSGSSNNIQEVEHD